MGLQKLATIALASAAFAILGADAGRVCTPKPPRIIPTSSPIPVDTTTNIELTDTRITQTASSSISGLSTGTVVTASSVPSSIESISSDSSSSAFDSSATSTLAIDSSATSEISSNLPSDTTTAANSGDTNSSAFIAQTSTIDSTTTTPTITSDSSSDTSASSDTLVPTIPSAILSSATATSAVTLPSEVCTLRTLSYIQDTVTMGFITQEELDHYVYVRQWNPPAGTQLAISFDAKCNKAFANAGLASKATSQGSRECLARCNALAASLTVGAGVMPGDWAHIQTCQAASFDWSQTSDNCLIFVGPTTSSQQRVLVDSSTSIVYVLD